ncbi:hypothetical protein [Dactylosporangium sp. NPDC049140]|uniref:hypothetical protein n=1 Tax=Dactylosporangium sp. NPDC049140 TaxID=3155647 RepID=UPI0033C26A56
MNRTKGAALLLLGALAATPTVDGLGEEAVGLRMTSSTDIGLSMTAGIVAVRRGDYVTGVAGPRVVAPGVAAEQLVRPAQRHGGRHGAQRRPVRANLTVEADPPDDPALHQHSTPGGPLHGGSAVVSRPGRRR